MEMLRHGDRFNVHAKAFLSAADHQTLALLYAPIAGTDALMLYLTLHGLLDRQSLSSDMYHHRDLISLLNLNIEAIAEARERLEGIGLLKSYCEGDHFIYELCAPLSADSFVNDGLLGTYLIQLISKTRFKKLMKLFKIDVSEKQGYHHLTKSFDDVYPEAPDEPDPDAADGELLTRTRGKSLPVGHSSFDWRLFSESINDDIKQHVMLNGVAKEKILLLHHVYGLTELEFRDILSKVYHKKKGMDWNMFGRLTRERHAQKKSAANRHAEQKESGTSVRSLPNDPVTYFKTITPEALLREMSDGMVSTADLRIVERLIGDIGLDPGVVNVLLAYTAKIKDGTLPGYAYFEKVGISWRKNDIKDVETAMEYTRHLKSEYQRKKKAATHRRGDDKPDVDVDWLDEYIESIESE